MTTDFTTLTTPHLEAPGLYHADVPDGWQQGRGAFGGLVLALLVRAMGRHEGDAQRSLRVLTAELCAPVLPGPVELRVDTLRRGGSVTTTTARLVQDGEVAAHAVGVLGRQRADEPRPHGLVAPAPRPWHDTPPVRLPTDFAPVFTQWFEFRPDGPPPFSGAPAAIASGWIRLKQPGPVRDAAETVALIDAWWPAHFTSDVGPRPIATISFTLDLVSDVTGFDREAPVYHRARLLAARDGYLVEQREIWTPAGGLVAINTQTIAVIK